MTGYLKMGLAFLAGLAVGAGSGVALIKLNKKDDKSSALAAKDEMISRYEEELKRYEDGDKTDVSDRKVDTEEERKKAAVKLVRPADDREEANTIAEANKYIEASKKSATVKIKVKPSEDEEVINVFEDRIHAISPAEFSATDPNEYKPVTIQLVYDDNDPQKGYFVDLQSRTVMAIDDTIGDLSVLNAATPTATGARYIRNEDLHIDYEITEVDDEPI